ncbi:MAG: 3D domain-containing protein [Clostridium sp.]|uniref:3D domain-containing protein n=1 Tax=Clostridium sp. TaxID=1506 RepID=UPI003F4158E8
MSRTAKVITMVVITSTIIGGMSVYKKISNRIKELESKVVQVESENGYLFKQTQEMNSELVTLEKEKGSLKHQLEESNKHLEKVKELLSKKNKEKQRAVQTTTNNNKVVSRGGVEYRKYIFEATGYAPNDPRAKDGMEFQGNRNVTASGMRPGLGVFAIDNSWIKFGTKIKVKMPDGSFRTGVAGDTGGAIKGNKIDIYFNTLAEANKFGRRKVEVYLEVK